MIFRPSNIKPLHVRYLRRIYIGLGLLFLALISGTIGFMLLENYSLVDAFYMTVITVSTVGFKEVRDLSKWGRIFTAFFIIFNIGIFAYVVTTVTSFILEGEFRNFFKDYSVKKQINQLSNHIVICGYGRLGKQATEELLNQNQLFIIIENNNEEVERLREKEEILFVDGDATKDEVLEEAQIENARALITTLPHDADNVFVTLTAREMNDSLMIISRASDGTSQGKLRRAGANHIIMPEIIGGTHMASLVLEPDIIEFTQLITGQEGASISFEEFSYDTLPKEYQNKTIKELDVRSKTGANIIGLKTAEGEYIINPSPDAVLKPSTKLIILGTRQQREQFKTAILNSGH